jgi:hypothetical protein
MRSTEWGKSYSLIFGLVGEEETYLFTSMIL